MGSTPPRDRALRFILRSMWTGFRLRCPRCEKGPMMAGPVRLHDVCSECGYRFEFAEGDWSGAVMIAQMLMGLAAIPLWLGLVLWTDLTFTWTVVWAVVIVIVLWILTYRNVKGLWFGWLYAAELAEVPRGPSGPSPGNAQDASRGARQP